MRGISKPEWILVLCGVVFLIVGLNGSLLALFTGVVLVIGALPLRRVRAMWQSAQSRKSGGVQPPPTRGEG